MCLVFSLYLSEVSAVIESLTLLHLSVSFSVIMENIISHFFRLTTWSDVITTGFVSFNPVHSSLVFLLIPPWCEIGAFGTKSGTLISRRSSGVWDEALHQTRPVWMLYCPLGHNKTEWACKDVRLQKRKSLRRWNGLWDKRPRMNSQRIMGA